LQRLHQYMSNFLPVFLQRYSLHFSLARSYCPVSSIKKPLVVWVREWAKIWGSKLFCVVDVGEPKMFSRTLTRSANACRQSTGGIMWRLKLQQMMMML
jgi:hypothetical protein